MNKPCAYCGKSDTPRHRGHIIPKSLFPRSTPRDIQRPTVPECETCKSLWTDAETQFRNLIVIAGEPNEEGYEKWDTVLRSFEKPSGKRWLSDVYNAMVPVVTDSGPRHMVYPYKDPRVNLVLRKIVRGFSAYHGIAECVDDDRVWVGYVPNTLPDSIRNQMLIHHFGERFFRYALMLFDEKTENDLGIESGWLFRFYESRDFLGVVAKSGNAKERFGFQLNPNLI
jgi:hypothetical protein